MRVAPQTWRLGHRGRGPAGAPRASPYSPLWSAEAPGGAADWPLDATTSGMLEIEGVDGTAAIILHHGPGAADANRGVDLRAVGLRAGCDRPLATQARRPMLDPAYS
jgi:hypothetical protein